MSLGDVYQEALERKYDLPKGWKANWPPTFDRELGEVGRIDDGKFNRGAMLANVGIHAEPDPRPGNPNGPWSFQSSEDISLAFGFDATVPGWEWIGDASAGVKVRFGRSEGAVLSVAESHEEALDHIDGLKKPLIEAARSGSLEVGQCVVVAKLVGDVGVLVTSAGSEGSFDASTHADIKQGSATLASFAADLSVANSTHAADHEVFNQDFTVAYRVLKLGTRGWWWWKRIDAEGLVPVDEEKSLDARDYFALFDE